MDDLTRVDADNLVLKGGGNTDAYARSGYHAVNKGATYTVTGAMSVTVSTADFAFVQIGHGSAYTDHSSHSPPSGSFSGVITVEAGGNVTFLGGQYADGDHSGSLALTSSGGLTLTADSGEDAYTVLGHGPDVRIIPDGQSTGSRAGDITIRVAKPRSSMAARWAISRPTA